MLDVIRDAWPWVLSAFVIGLLCGWLVTWLYYLPPRSRSAAGVRSAAAKPVAGAPAKGAGRTAARPALDLAAGSKVLGVKVKLDDLELVEGIGPRIADLLRVDGIATWRALGATTPDHVRKVLDAAGFRYNLAEPSTWPAQARLLAEGKWVAFKKLTDRLVGGR